MLSQNDDEEQAEVARVFKDVRERAIGFDLASKRLDEFFAELQQDNEQD
jgi:hypothetical protein